ncbi:hypothetical protein LTR15_012520 [Elasticomyces elasticus]|nr:hypothetical protein LTR15_012520 [Elasticomyces elasticus]
MNQNSKKVQKTQIRRKRGWQLSVVYPALGDDANVAEKEVKELSLTLSHEPLSIPVARGPEDAWKHSHRVSASKYTTRSRRMSINQILDIYQSEDDTHLCRLSPTKETAS